MSDQPAQTVLPRWRGFNLLEMFTVDARGDWREDDFVAMARWGFDFVRLPMCYTLWCADADVFTPLESGLARIDRGVELGRQHGLHVCLNLHRAPGYCVNAERAEPLDLWHDPRALEAFCFHWRLLAERYRGIASEALSFDLVNEPPALDGGFTRADHERVVRAAVGAIREVDPRRRVIVDGLNYGNVPCPELADLGVAQSCRGYMPFGLTHYMAPWVHGDLFPMPAWPMTDFDGDEWDPARLREHYEPWAKLAAGGVGVHCGELGCYNATPHPVMLSWLRDLLATLRELNIGWAMWNLRGPFGVLDSGRADVQYEDFRGQALDRKLLNLLQEF